MSNKLMPKSKRLLKRPLSRRLQLRLRLLPLPNSKISKMTSAPVRKRTTATKNKTRRKFLFTSPRVSNLIPPLTNLPLLMKVKLLPKKAMLKANKKLKMSKLLSRRKLF